MEPASTIIRKFGGEAAVRKITGAGETAPYRWQHPKDKGGTGGLIPYKHAIKLLSFAAENGIAVSASDFLDASADPAQPASEPAGAPA